MPPTAFQRHGLVLPLLLSASGLTRLSGVLVLPKLCHAVPRHAVPCYALPCYAMPCYAVLCHAMLCHAMPCCEAAQGV